MRRDDAPGGVTHADEGFRATRRKRVRVDFLLVPQFQPAGLERLRTSTAGLGGAFTGSNAATLARKPSALNGVASSGSIPRPDSSPSCRTAFYDDRVPRADQEHLAAEQPPNESFQDLSCRHAVMRHPEHHQIGLVQIQQCGSSSTAAHSLAMKPSSSRARRETCGYAAFHQRCRRAARSCADRTSWTVSFPQFPNFA